jgi:tRNA A-37 threonylcarbamoyl transferase component Bud32
MRDIEELIDNNKKYKKAIIQKKLKSKKNAVAYITIKDKPRVIKWFVPGLKRQMKIEYNILQEGSSKLGIPPVYKMDEKNNVIIMGYIIGENLCDVINDEKTTKAEKERLMILLAEWFSDFHKYFKKSNEFRIRGDSTLRNFILSDRIWGVDFEESRTGEPIEDIATMCSSILSTDPMFTSEKFQLCQKFIESYSKSVSWNLTNINNEIAYALLERIQWRPEQEENLRKFSTKIRESGLK